MAKHGYEQTSIDDIRQLLLDNSILPEQLAGKTKTELVEILLQLNITTNTNDNCENEPETTILDMVVEEPENLILSTESIVPSIGEYEWTTYVLEKMTDKELQKGMPTCDGLRRMTESLIGNIVERSILFQTSPNIQNSFTATVGLRVGVLVENINHPRCGEIIVEEDIADAGRFNTDKPYSAYPSATAITRAEGRCLRKILRLHTLAAEEVSEAAEKDDLPIDTTWIPDDSITISDEQTTVINLLCSRCNINVKDFINSGSKQYDDIKEIDKTTATSMIQHLNKISQGRSSIR